MLKTTLLILAGLVTAVIGLMFFAAAATTYAPALPFGMGCACLVAGAASVKQALVEALEKRTGP